MSDSLTERFRSLMGRQAISVAIITSRLKSEPVGMTATSVLSVSLAPPLLLISVTRDSRTAQGVLQSGRFAVHLLSAEQEELANQFATPGRDHFAHISWHPEGEGETPVLEDVLGLALCRVQGTFPVADHYLVLGLVEGCRLLHDDRPPLVRFARSYHTVGRPECVAREAALIALVYEGLPGWGRVT